MYTMPLDLISESQSGKNKFCRRDVFMGADYKESVSGPVLVSKHDFIQ